MHIADQETGNLGANAIVGGSTALATGAAMSSKMQGTNQVTVCFFGDGALGQGVLYEAMNMASLWKLPIIYVCENNMYNEYTHFSETTAGEMSTRPRRLWHSHRRGGRAEHRKFTPQHRGSSNEHGAAKVQAFLLCNTYRYHGHDVGDIQRSYHRSKEEEQLWMTQRDPLKSDHLAT